MCNALIHDLNILQQKFLKIISVYIHFQLSMIHEQLPHLFLYLFLRSETIRTTVLGKSDNFGVEVFSQPRIKNN